MLFLMVQMLVFFHMAKHLLENHLLYLVRMNNTFQEIISPRIMLIKEDLCQEQLNILLKKVKN